MSEQAIAAIREMLQPGATLQVIESQVPTVPVGRKQVVLTVDPHGVMTELTEGRLGGTMDNRSFLPIGCEIGPTDAEQLAPGSFVLWHQSAPDTSRITYKIVDTIYWALTLGPDGRWTKVEEGTDFGAMANRLFDIVTAPGSAKDYRDWQILPKVHIMAHAEAFPGAMGDEPQTDTAPKM